jgi:hypothetical protein
MTDKSADPCLSLSPPSFDKLRNRIVKTLLKREPRFRFVLKMGITVAAPFLDMTIGENDII